MKPAKKSPLKSFASKRATIAPDVKTSTEGIPPPPPMPGDDFAMPTRELVRPANQLNLTEAELNEEVAKMMTANNPAAPKNIARYNMKERAYKFEPMVDQTIVHYATDGWLLHKSSEEAKKQLEMEKMEAEAQARIEKAAAAEKNRASDGPDAAAAPTKEEAGTDTDFDDSRALRNQFNFAERAAQTSNPPPRDRETYTEPPPTATVSGACTQFTIYDEYIKDLERQKHAEAQKAAKGKKGALAAADHKPGHGKDGKGRQGDAPENPLASPAMRLTSNIVDRMVNQNMFEEIAMDFRYWEDPTDKFKVNEGSLLPLWKFENAATKRKQVTALCWNPEYSDLFAAGYGSFEYMRPCSGLICIFSIKNPSHPETSIKTDSGVMSLHFHPQFSNLLAVGCYDGSVAVYDVRGKSSKPIYEATVKSGKHNDPVWQVMWQTDELAPQLQFISCSSDGLINVWTLNKSELTHENLTKLKAVKTQPAAGPGAGQELAAEDEGVAARMAAGTSMDFCRAPGQEHMYVVGTEEGAIHKCSKAYSSDYLCSYLGHNLPVYAVKWNYLYHKVFLSASADWSVKLWDSTEPKLPIMNFDLNDSVGDVAWAPHSASIFAAVTDDGKVHVFDLAVNKTAPMASQKIVKKAKLTKIVFNAKYPIVLVGDDKGCVTSLKLSPNLQRVAKTEKGQKLEDAERAKLEHVVEIARKSAADAAAGAAQGN